MRQRRARRADGAREGTNAGLPIGTAILCDDRLDLAVELPDCPAEPQGKAKSQQVDEDGIEDEEQLGRGEDVRRFMMLMSGSTVIAVAPLTAIFLARPAKPSSGISQRAQDDGYEGEDAQARHTSNGPCYQTHFQ